MLIFFSLTLVHDCKVLWCPSSSRRRLLKNLFLKTVFGFTGHPTAVDGKLFKLYQILFNRNTIIAVTSSHVHPEFARLFVPTTRGPPPLPPSRDYNAGSTVGSKGHGRRSWTLIAYIYAKLADSVYRWIWKHFLPFHRILLQQSEAIFIEQRLYCNYTFGYLRDKKDESPSTLLNESAMVRDKSTQITFNTSTVGTQTDNAEGKSFLKYIGNEGLSHYIWCIVFSYYNRTYNH